MRYTRDLSPVPSRLRSGEVFAYVGLPQNIKDLKDPALRFEVDSPGRNVFLNTLTQYKRFENLVLVQGLKSVL